MARKMSKGETKARAVLAKLRKMTGKEFDEYLRLVNAGDKTVAGDREAFQWFSKHVHRYPHRSV